MILWIEDLQLESLPHRPTKNYNWEVIKDAKVSFESKMKIKYSGILIENSEWLVFLLDVPVADFVGKLFYVISARVDPDVIKHQERE